MTIQELKDRITPPVHVAADRDWNAAADCFHVEFAHDYRQVIETYGHGFFEPGTTLFDPRRDNFGLYVTELLEIMADPELRRENQPLPPHPGSGARLLPVTSDGSGGYIMTVVVDGVQDESTYWLGDLDDDEFIEVEGPFSAVLLMLSEHALPVDLVWQITGPFRSW